jgi:rfaE bifunctional protein kinase chain/domain/rfaE bifunctional protein nucleotidyltransferase chain/domain
MSQKKIVKSSSSKIFTNLRKRNKKVVLCHGVFDLLHYGHISHFEQAKKFGDILVVSVTPDNYVNKGPSRPAFNENIRMNAISALKIVDYVILNNSSTAINSIKKVKPHFYCKGPDYKDHSKDLTKGIKQEIKAIKSIGGRIIYTKGQTFSSSNLINSFSDNLSEQTKTNLNLIKKNYDFKKIRNLIENFKNLKVLIIGELIVDEYVFCDALGKSGKDPFLVLKDIKSEKYLGGAGAIAKNLSNFSNKISLFSMIGQNKESFNFIRKNLKSVNIKFVAKKNSPTILKKRFLDINSGNKVLGVYQLNDDALDFNNEKKFQKIISKNISKFDLVVISDYGHGLISNKTARLISKKSKFLALNAQINAANIGFHSLNKYKNVDCIIINEKEIRYELRNRDGDIKVLMKKLSNDQNFKNVIVTQGTSGAILFNKKQNIFSKSDAFESKAVDKIGAGDTMLSLISLCMKSGISHNLSLLIGSLAAALSVKDYGNKKEINKVELLKSIENLLK